MVQSAVHTTHAELLHRVLAVQLCVSRVRESRPQQVSLVSQNEHFLLPGWTQVRGQRPRRQSHMVRFLNLTNFITLDRLPSLSFFTWEMAVWMSSSKLLSTKRTATVYES